MPRSSLAWLFLAFGLLIALVLVVDRTAAEPEEAAARPYRSPVALAISADGSRLLTANQSAGTVSLIDPKSGRVLDEQATGDRPSGVAFAPDGRLALVTHWYGYDLAFLEVGPDRLKMVGRLEVGPEPRGVVVGQDGRNAYAAVGVANEVVRVDLETRQVSGRLEVGREPRHLAISPDGKRLVVGNAREGTLSVIDLATWTVERSLPTAGANLRQIAFDPEGDQAYVANMFVRGFATTRNNIDLGWVLGQRITRVSISGEGPYQTLSLDPQGEAAADAHGMAISQDGTLMAVSLGGTHEVMLFRNDRGRLPWRSGGSRDLISPTLLRAEDGRFQRLALGGRPTEIAFAPDGRTLYVANFLDDSVQVVDAEAARLAQTIPLGEPTEPDLVRRGEALFHDAMRSFNQWYSCATCHPDGHTNGLTFDTLNDGWQDLRMSPTKSQKKVPSLRRVAQTGPWTWHGWQTDLGESVLESFTKSMQGPQPDPEEVRAVVAYLATLDYPANPNRRDDGSLTESAQRGAKIFRSPRAACASCHSGAEFTDGEIHLVGLEESEDVYKGYNPPSLRGLYDKDPYLHDGRAGDLREVLTKWHNPEDVTGLGALDESELEDLIAYLKSL